MNILFYLKPKNEIVYLYDDFTLRQVLEKMEKHRYSAVPVINRNGNYVGTLTEGDLLWHLKATGFQELKDMEDILMTKIRRYWHNEPVNVDCKIEDLITTSMNQNFVPVIDDKKIFIGIVTRRDIIQYCYDQVQATPDKLRSSYSIMGRQ